LPQRIGAKAVHVLHLRLRSAQQGFAPTPVKHTGQQRVQGVDKSILLYIKEALVSFRAGAYLTIRLAQANASDIW